MTKAALINLIAEQNELPRKTAAAVYATLESVMLGSLHPKGVGEFTLPGLLKVTLRKVPARRAGTLVRNPGHRRDGEGRRQAGQHAGEDPGAVEAQIRRRALTPSTTVGASILRTCRLPGTGDPG